MKLPAFQFYPADWRKDPGVQALNFHDRGVWFEILCLLHESSDRGKLLLNGKAMPDDALARLLGLDKQVLTKTLITLLDFGVASRDPETGALLSRRMVRDENLRRIRTESGKKGGNPLLLNQSSNQKPTTLLNQKSTPSSSVSSSVSSSERKEEANASSKKREKSFVAPTREEVRQYFADNGYTAEYADKAFRHYDLGEWKDSNGRAVKNWKQKFATNWFKDEGKTPASNPGTVTAENAQYAVMQPMPYGPQERWPIEEYNRLKHTTEYKLLGYE